jgi:hypothetical protein
MFELICTVVFLVLVAVAAYAYAATKVVNVLFSICMRGLTGGTFRREA